MKNVIVRSCSGLIYIGMVIGAVLAGGIWLVLLLSLLAALGIHEFKGMTRQGKRPRLLAMLDLSVGILMIISTWLIFTADFTSALTLTVLWGIMLMVRVAAQIYTHDEDPVNVVSRSIFALFYVVMPLCALIALYYFFATPHLVLALFIFIWINDTGAFCVGSLFGKHRLFERISPKKSWEGFWGGLLFCIISAIIMQCCFGEYYRGMTTFGMCRLGVLVSVAATFGDLFESMIKRSVGVKDSGRLIPGHGGILDRIDSLLFVAPACFIYFLIF